jgi:hypothetical protein
MPRSNAAILTLVADESQLRPVLLRLQDRRLPLPSQILERACLEQRLLDSRR